VSKNEPIHRIYIISLGGKKMKGKQLGEYLGIEWVEI